MTKVFVLRMFFTICAAINLFWASRLSTFMAKILTVDGYIGIQFLFLNWVSLAFCAAGFAVSLALAMRRSWAIDYAKINILALAGWQVAVAGPIAWFTGTEQGGLPTTIFGGFKIDAYDKSIAEFFLEFLESHVDLKYFLIDNIIRLMLFLLLWTIVRSRWVREYANR